MIFAEIASRLSTSILDAFNLFLMVALSCIDDSVVVVVLILILVDDVCVFQCYFEASRCGLTSDIFHFDSHGFGVVLSSGES